MYAYDEIRQYEFQRALNQKIGQENERIAQQKSTVPKERIKEIREKEKRNYEILKKPKILHFTHISEFCTCVRDAHFNQNKPYTFTPNETNMIFHYLESRKLIEISNQEKIVMFQEKISNGFDEIESIYQCRTELINEFFNKNTKTDFFQLFSNAELQILQDNAVNYFISVGDEKAVIELKQSKTFLETNDLIIRHINIKEKRQRAKKMIKHLPKRFKSILK
jgi:hypothetical protein